MKRVQTNNALKPVGHYSQAIVHQGLVYVSGQLPIHPEDGVMLKGDIGQQVRMVLHRYRQENYIMA